MFKKTLKYWVKPCFNWNQFPVSKKRIRFQGAGSESWRGSTWWGSWRGSTWWGRCWGCGRERRLREVTCQIYQLFICCLLIFFLFVRKIVALLMNILGIKCFYRNLTIYKECCSSTSHFRCHSLKRNLNTLLQQNNDIWKTFPIELFFCLLK